MVVLTRLVKFFNHLFKHSLVLVAMTDVMIISIMKSNLKDPSVIENYWIFAISISLSKFIEKCMLNRLDFHLQTCENQFRYKRSHCTETYFFTLKQVLNYCRDAGGQVSVCFVDIKSAFVRVSYNKLISKLIKRGVPKSLLNLLIFWYAKQQLSIDWAGVVATNFSMSNGMRQGSLISPLLFSMSQNEQSGELNSVLRQDWLPHL